MDGLTDADREQLDALREALREAILAGDSAKHAQLCTDDVLLMHPGTPIVSGREAVRQHEEEIFALVTVKKLEVVPVSTSGTGWLAYEVGTQELATEPALEGFAAKRKYAHVMRKQADGTWKFAVLMSNDSE